MGLLNILSKAMAAKAPEPVHSRVPLGLHQGTAVQLPELDIVMAQADGSIFPTVPAMQTISAVGIMTLFGKKVYNCYLNDGKSYLRLVTENDDVKEVTLFYFRDEVNPASVEEWEFWMGRYQKDSAGEFVRDSSGVAIMAEYGLIGWPQFQIDGATPIQYNRSWFASNTGVEPVSATQRVYSSDGSSVTINQDMMEYDRVLGTEASPTVETLLAASSDVEATVNISIGIKLTLKDLKIFPA